MSALADGVAILVVAIAAAVVVRRIVAWARRLRAAPRRVIPLASDRGTACGDCDGCGGSGRTERR